MKPMDALHVHRPTLAPQKHMDTAIAVSNARLDNLLDPLAQWRLVSVEGLVAMRPAVEPEHGATAPFAHAEPIPNPVDDLSKLAKRYTFLTAPPRCCLHSA